MLVIGAHYCSIPALVLRAWEPASLRALFPREVRLISWDGRPQPRRHSRTRLIGLTGLTQVQQDHGCQATRLASCVGSGSRSSSRSSSLARVCEGEMARWTRWRARSWAVEQALWQQRGWSGAGRTDDDLVYLPWGGTTRTASARYHLPGMQVCTGQYALTNHPKQDIALSPVACRLAQAPHTLAPPSPPLPYPRRRRQAGNAGHQMGCQSARVGWRTRGDQMSLVGHGCHGTAIPYSGWEAHRPASWGPGPGGLDLDLVGLGWARPKSSQVDQGHSTPLQRTPGRPTCTTAVAPSRMVLQCLAAHQVWLVPAAAKMEGVRQQDWD